MLKLLEKQQKNDNFPDPQLKVGNFSPRLLRTEWYVYIFFSLSLSEMSTVNSNDLNLKLWNAARDGNNDAVLAAITAGSNVNWNNNSHVSDNNI